MSTELAGLDAIGQAELVRLKEARPIELLEAAIARIEAVNPTINAVVTRLFEQAREQACRPLPAGPLSGVPFLLKDLGAEQAGVLQTSGSRAMRDYRPAADSPLVTAYRAAGLIIAGRTSTPEFGNHSTTEPVLFGPTLNPWALDRTVGGSSGGSAAAVASGMVPAANGGDGAGSLRIPASCCGLFGLKPSRGRVSRAPGGEEIGGFNTRHAITRSVRDSAALLDVIAGPLPGDPYFATPPSRPYLDEVTHDPGRLRIAWSDRAPLGTAVDQECVVAVRETAQLLASLGHELEEAAPDFDAEVMIGPMVLVWALGNLEDAMEAQRILGRPLRQDELEDTTWELVDHGRRFTALDLSRAIGRLGEAARAIGPFFQTYDAWLTPTLARPPEGLGVLNRSQGGAEEWWRFDCEFNAWNPVANITGQPAMSLPLHWTSGDLPVGSLITGRYGDEATLFRLGAQLEHARPWAGRLPSVHASRKLSADA
ncbi:MAG TPA: amidase [Candidatus Dormibacteraeota bacterium]